MAGRTKALTDFGRDLDSLLKRAGKFTLREYADECGVSYKYLLQLRTSPTRRPGKLYIDLLKPFTRLRILDLAEAHRLSQDHRGRLLSLTECRTLFPQATEQELVESIKKALEVKGVEEVKAPADPAGEAGGGIRGGLTSGPRGQLYRRVFVGRQAEMNQLRAAFDEVVGGEGKLVMVSGEPGIGKTALCGQLAAYVASRGGASLVGHCYEVGSLSLPYLAFIEALRSHVLACDAGELTRELGAGAPDVARILSEITERLSVAPRPRGDPDTEKYRLLQAVADFLGNMAKAQPLLLVLEDLHGADHGTLEMLQHVARNLTGKRLLVLGTYRDVEVDRTHPLSAALAELRRLPSFGQILLRGLTTEEVARMLSGIIGRDIASGAEAAVHAQTEGNPLFVEEVARYLVQEGVMDRDGALKQLPQNPAFEMRIPVGLRDVIGKRLSGLSERCNRMLSVAAVMGRDFRLDTLEEVAGMPEKDLFEAIGEATRAAVLEERSQPGMTLYRFAHAFFRQTLYEEMIAPQRLRLHQQVAGSLEVLYANHPDEHAAELAEHFSQSTKPADLRKAVAYCELAAKKATGVYAYGEAVRSLRQALRVQEILDPDDVDKRCDLLLSTGEALLLAGEPRSVLDNEAPAAFSLAEGSGDRKCALRACLMALMARVWETAGGFQGTPEEILWAERINRYAEPDTIARIWADAASGVLAYNKGLAALDVTSLAEGVSLLRKAVDTARRIDDAEGLFAVAPWYMIFTSVLNHGEERLRLAEEVANRPRKGVSLFSHSTGLVFSGYAFLETGKRDLAEEVWREYLAMAKRTEQAYLFVNSAQVEGQLALLDGRLEEAVEILRNMLARGGELGLSFFATTVAYIGLARPLFHLGKASEELQLVRSTYPWPWNIAVCLAHMGREKEAVELLEQSVAAYPVVGTEQDESLPLAAVGILEAAVLVKHKRIAELLLGRLESTTVCTTGMYWLTCIPRHLGGAAALLERYHEARQHYQEAIRVCTEMRFRPELALSRLQLAELLLEHYPDEKKEAIEHLDFAIKEFREMKMQPSLERALRHKSILKA